MRLLVATRNRHKLTEIRQIFSIPGLELVAADEIEGLPAEVEEDADTFEGNALKKEITLKNKVVPEIEVIADLNMLYSILQNLISNAIKFTYKGGNIIVEALEKDDFVKISVIDNGIGIRNEDKEKIFRIDQSHSTKGTENEQGTGLGLILVKDMVEKHGGKVWIESELTKGTAFYFLLPRG